jgi:hypothetical protein
MIHETSAWLTWALDHRIEVPRIPSRRVDEGGFDRLMRLPGAKAVINRWWAKTFDLLDRW